MRVLLFVLCLGLLGCAGPGTDPTGTIDTSEPVVNEDGFPIHLEPGESVEFPLFSHTIPASNAWIEESRLADITVIAHGQKFVAKLKLNHVEGHYVEPEISVSCWTSLDASAWRHALNEPEVRWYTVGLDTHVPGEIYPIFDWLISETDIPGLLDLRCEAEGFVPWRHNIIVAVPHPVEEAVEDREPIILPMEDASDDPWPSDVPGARLSGPQGQSWDVGVPDVETAERPEKAK